MVIDVVEIHSVDNITFVCNVSSAGSLARWTYLLGSTGTSLMSYNNGTCTVSPSDSFLSETKYSYTCSRRTYQVTMYNDGMSSNNNHILACRDALQLDGTGSTWIIKIKQGNTTGCSNCQPTMTFDILEVIEGNSLVLTCRGSSSMSYINWSLNFGSRITAMAVQNNICSTSPSPSFLDNASEYIYTCNDTVYKVIILNVQRRQHNDMYMCTLAAQNEGTGSNWIIKVKAAVSSVILTSTNSSINVIENTAVEFTCKTSTARPAASIYWYILPNEKLQDAIRIIENITTTTDYNDLSVTTNNADEPYVVQGNEYRVIENTLGILSCSVMGGYPAPMVSWNCDNVSPTNQSTIKTNGNTTTTLTWTALRIHNGSCTCTSQQAGFRNETIDISLVVLYPPSLPVLIVNGTDVVSDVTFIAGTTRSIECTADSKPTPDRYTWSGPTIIDSLNIQTLTFNPVEMNNAGQYQCSVHNTMNPSRGDPVVGSNTSLVNVLVIYKADNLAISQGSDYRIIEDDIGMLSCSVNRGYPKATLTWNCINISGVESTNNSGEIITNTLTWTTTRDQDGTCSCTSKQTGFPASVVEVHVTILHPPDYPTHFRFFDDLSTSSSIQLAWNPGYNGGSQQTFYIKYKAIDLSSWKYKTVPDNRKQTLIFTLTGLNANTFYEIIVLASNEQGNSTESQNLLVHTTELEREDSPTLGQLVGGFAGGSIVFGLIMFIFGMLIGRKVSCSGFSKKTSLAQKQRENEYELMTPPSLSNSPLQPANTLTQNESKSDASYENTT
ncbi:hypothetical protein ACF0H5_019131 [Mactra antiquata]